MNIAAGMDNADQQNVGSQGNMGSQQPGAGVTGSGEELALTLEKVVSQLDIISRTLHVLEQRVSMNEESVNNCLGYFQENKAQRESKTYEPVQQSMYAQQQSLAEARLVDQTLRQQQQMRYDLEELRQLTAGVQDGVRSVADDSNFRVTMGQNNDMQDTFQQREEVGVTQDVENDINDFTRD